MSAATTPTPAVLHERLLARLRMRHLHLIAALAAAGHLGRAAEAIHVSQPAATQMLREIESLLGLRLFERHARGMRATAAGTTLAAQARTMLDALRVVGDGAIAHAKETARPLRIGALPAAVASLLRPASGALLARPGPPLHVTEDSSERLLAGLASGAFDMVLLRQPAALTAGQRFVALRRDRMVVFTSPRHPAARKARVRWSDLAQSRWLLAPEGYAVRALIDAALQRARLVPTLHPIQTVSPMLIEALLAGDDAVVPGPRSVLDALPRSLAVELKLALHAPLEPLGALYRSDAEAGNARAVAEVLAVLKAAVPPG